MRKSDSKTSHDWALFPPTIGPTLNVDALAQLLYRDRATILADRCRAPERVPPAHKPLGTKEPCGCSTRFSLGCVHILTRALTPSLLHAAHLAGLARWIRFNAHVRVASSPRPKSRPIDERHFRANANAESHAIATSASREFSSHTPCSHTAVNFIEMIDTVL